MIIEGLEVNSPEYWEIRHRREPWLRTSGWVHPVLMEAISYRAKVLEVGGGQGAFSWTLLDERPDLTIKCVDISPTAIEKAKKLYIDANLTFQIADVFNFTKDLKDETYDYIISIQNFEHWPVDTHKEAFHQIWKRLKPRGRFFFTGVGLDWDLNQMNYGPMDYKGKTILTPNDYHYNKWSEQSVYDLFMTQKARSVKFWRLRGKDRVVAEVEKE
jgi:cyclopropane fatty-acyl-phospholipid synthase-like methyltransferase